MKLASGDGTVETELRPTGRTFSKCVLPLSHLLLETSASANIPRNPSYAGPMEIALFIFESQVNPAGDLLFGFT
jgi:hypothetical protein